MMQVVLGCFRGTITEEIASGTTTAGEKDRGYCALEHAVLTNSRHW